MKNKKTPIKTRTIPTKEYVQVLSSLKKQIKEAQIKAVFSVNKEMLKLYWAIGKIIAEKQEANGWGTGVVEKLAEDLQKAFPDIGGFSRTNVFRMKAFFIAYEKIPQAVGQIEDLVIFSIPWGHNAVLLEKIKNYDQRIWYAQKTLENSWSRSTLETWIQADLFNRKGKALTNFQERLPSPQSDLAQQTLKDPYLFDFLALQENYQERDMEKALINHIQKFLLELGHGFAFIGQQVHLVVDEQDYYIDLLFYHTKLHCYIVVELKARAFDPRDAGQINFYLSAVDDTLRSEGDNPTIGLLLCKSKKKLTVEYALRRSASPIGVASYEVQIMEKLPKELKGSLPTVEEIESELEKQEIINEDAK